MTTSRARTPALSSEVLAQFARVCSRIADEAADERGFVLLRKLLQHFHAQLLIRPLLVEGMLAKPSDGGPWTVLVDSEIYGVSSAQVAAESAKSPLPSRFRFTVAHELAHSLAFRPSEFGIRLHDSINSNGARKEVVKSLEVSTDRITPLLLFPEKALIDFCKAQSGAHTVEEFVSLRKTVGVSREVLVNRLRALSHTDANGARNLPALKDTALLLAEWMPDGSAALRSWPIFANFDRNILPEFLIRLTRQDKLPARTVFADESFALCGGASPRTVTNVRGGTMGSPGADVLGVQCLVEQSTRKQGSKVLVLVRKL